MLNVSEVWSGGLAGKYDLQRGLKQVSTELSGFVYQVITQNCKRVYIPRYDSVRV